MSKSEEFIHHSENVRTLFDNYSHRYDDLVENTKYTGQRWMEDFLKQSTNIAMVLDIGCANGADGKIIKKYLFCSYE